MIDSDGFRPNVGIVICNTRGRLFWAKRVGQSGWQFPQGGIKSDETPEQALYRELDEEVGLTPDDVKVLHRTQDWLHYRLPEQYIRRHENPVCIGQKQVWFLLSLESQESRFRLDSNQKPEFDDWCWVDYWHPITEVVEFKRNVYHQALSELEDSFRRFTGQHSGHKESVD